MSTDPGLHRAPVIDLALARARLGPSRRRGSTLVVRVSTMKADEEIYRYIGLDEDLALAEVPRVIATAFSLPDAPPAPAHFAGAPGAAAPGTLGEALRDGFSFTWGLWRFDLELAQRHPRDGATPPAVCIAGAGDLGGEPFDIAAVNRRLIGDDRADDILRAVRPELRDVIVRSRMFDYVLLLQALDVEAGGVDKRAREAAATLPRERSARGRDAFWCVLLALACFADEETTDTITESTFEALGWGFMTAPEVRELCAGSLVRLASLGVWGPGEAAPVDRLEVFRALLRR